MVQPELIVKMTNEELYNSFLSEPMKASVCNIWKSRIELWFTNNKKVTLRKAERISHNNLKIGDLKEFQIVKIELEGKPERYVLHVVGENNSMKSHEIQKMKSKKHTRKISKLRNFKEGIYIIRLYGINEKTMTVSIDGEEHTFGIPRNENWKTPELYVDTEIKITHKEAVSSKGNKYTIGIISTEF